MDLAAVSGKKHRHILEEHCCIREAEEGLEE